MISLKQTKSDEIKKYSKSWICIRLSVLKNISISNNPKHRWSLSIVRLKIFQMSLVRLLEQKKRHKRDMILYENKSAKSSAKLVSSKIKSKQEQIVSLCIPKNFNKYRQISNKFRPISKKAKKCYQYLPIHSIRYTMIIMENEIRSIISNSSSNQQISPKLYDQKKWSKHSISRWTNCFSISVANKSTK